MDFRYILKDNLKKYSILNKNHCTKRTILYILEPLTQSLRFGAFETTVIPCKYSHMQQKLNF
jgi:predicted GH43/DUF377 family glycosyl hydrolase